MVVHLIGQVGDVLRQPIDPNVAAIEPHLLQEHPERPVRDGLGARLRPQRIAELE